ncbi:MAG: hypothetical protein NZ578_01465 [Candidatus Binatia bacterium]|nr:hypothetical protein [Candidatus Binatia bacterium]
MQYWVVLLAACYGVSGCTTLAPWRHGNLNRDIARAMASCAETSGRSQVTGWTEVVRCGNDRVRSLLAKHGSPYAGLVEAALACRLAVAQQIDTGVIPAEAGKAKIVALDAQLQALPGSVVDLLDTIAALSGRGEHH